jgi:mono/diheme cytochrome c family protein
MMNGRIARAALLALPLLAAACAQQEPKQAEQAPPPGGLPPPLTVAERPSATGGERLYVEKCGMCHGPGAMGTGLLARRVDEPLLESRKDLTADYVVQAARSGIGNMPAIARGEVSDEEMKQIAAYLASDKPGAAK